MMTCLLRKLFGAAIGVVLISTLTRAQADFRPAYIISVAGDTVRGQLDYSGGRRVNYQCRFREAKGVNIITYSPWQLRGYGFPNDRLYQTLRVAKSLAPGDFSTQRLFLEVLVRGAVSLYARLDENGDQLYYVRAGVGLALPLANEHSLSIGLRAERTNGFSQASGVKIRTKPLLLSAGLRAFEAPIAGMSHL